MKKFSKGASSSRSNSRRSNFSPRMQLIDLPQQVLPNILLFVACNSLTDITRAKVVCKTFKNVIKEEVFLNEVYLFPLGDPDWYLSLPHLTKFRLRCFELGNSSAFFMRGQWEYFSNSHMEEGLEAIRIAAEKGYDLAIYTYTMIRRIMTPHSVSDSPLINNLTRDFYTQTRRKINETNNSFTWAAESPPLFEEKIDLISTVPLQSCQCAPYTSMAYGLFDERVKGGRGSPMYDRCLWNHTIHFFLSSGYGESF